MLHFTSIAIIHLRFRGLSRRLAGSSVTGSAAGLFWREYGVYMRAVTGGSSGPAVEPHRQTELAGRYRRLLSIAGPVEIMSIDARIADLAAELRADYADLKLPDALHLAAAIEAGCDAFISGDKRLKAVLARIPVITLDRIATA